MKLIISRKGLDTAAGGFANPLLPGNRPLALPIPDSQSPITYGDIAVPDHRDLIGDLGRGKLRLDQGAHLDPDLDPASLPRDAHWQPLFGQAGAAASHLAKHGVGPGDLFLFYGWFRNVTRQADGWRFVKHSPDRHILYGWFQIGIDLNLAHAEVDVPAWTHYHPHHHGTRERGNRLYIATEKLSLAGQEVAAVGAGLFRHINEDHILTEPGQTRSRWRLPRWFHPAGRASCLSYHDNPTRWQLTATHSKLQNVYRGQEFVLDTKDYPEAITWAARLIHEGQ